MDFFFSMLEGFKKSPSHWTTDVHIYSIDDLVQVCILLFISFIYLFKYPFVHIGIPELLPTIASRTEFRTERK